MDRVNGMLHVIEIGHPLGRSLVAATERGVKLVALRAGKGDPVGRLAREEGLGVREGGRGPAGKAARQLMEYFHGQRKRFSLDLDLGGTRFQRAVWKALAAVPFGKVVTYGELAMRVKRPGAARACGSACGANPVPVIVPCHRVVAAGGGLGGFGGGLPLKRKLLALEGLEY